MLGKITLGLVVAAMGVALVFGVSTLIAAEPAVTKISITGMHCEGCAGLVKKKLAAIEHVKEVKVILKDEVAEITAKDDGTPSAKAIWETVEKAGYKPVKLVGPAGTFTKLPPN